MSEPARRPRPGGGVSGKDIGDEYVFYCKERNKVHVLNGTAREIYLLCDGTRTETEVVHGFMKRYGVDEETARRDVLETIEELVDLSVLTVP